MDPTDLFVLVDEDVVRVRLDEHEQAARFQDPEQRSCMINEQEMHVYISHV